MLLVVCFGLGQYWQYQLRKLMGVTDYNMALVVASPFVAALVFCLILLIGRGLRGLYRWVARLLNRWIGPRAASAVGWILVAGVAYLVVSGLLLHGFVNLAERGVFGAQRDHAPRGSNSRRPSLRSGGPGSLVPWDSLGREGRKFIGTGPSAADIEKFSDKPAMEPIRAYAGLESASDTESRAALAVDDLERAGGFQRKNLLVVTTTGSGWVDPASVNTFEYLSGGDSAIVAIQYSYLPSWISYLVDQRKAREAGRDLFDAVYDRWSKLPQDQRPRLFVGRGKPRDRSAARPHSVANTTCATAPPARCSPGRPTSTRCSANSATTATPGARRSSPSTRTDGPCGSRTIRAPAYPPAGQPWDGSRVLYLMHPSDPIVWWSPHLIFSEPDWISEPPGKDVLEGMFWMPVRDLLAGHRRPAVRHRRSGRPRPQVHDRVRRRVECRHAAGRDHGQGPGQPQEHHQRRDVSALGVGVKDHPAAAGATQPPRHSPPQ